MRTHPHTTRLLQSARSAILAATLGLPAMTLAGTTTIFDANFDNGTVGANTTASGLGTPTAGTWSFTGGTHGGITTDASDKAALFAKNTTTALSWVTPQATVNTVGFGTTYPNTRTIDAGQTNVAVIANLASPGPITGSGFSTTISFNWGQCGTANSGLCKYAFVRGLDASGNEVFELLFSQLNPANTSQIYARGATDSSTTRTSVSAGTPQGTLLINGFGTDTTFSLPGTATTKPTGLIGITVTLANGQVTYGFSKGTASGNPLTYPVNSAATTISKLEFSTISATDASGSIGYWLNNVQATAQTPATYTLTYDGNAATSGTAPVDGSSPYVASATVTALNNTGGLTKTGFTFSGWNTQANGGGTDRSVASTFSMPAADTTLYAKWVSATASITASPTFPASVSTTYGTASGTTSVGVSGAGLMDDITATAPTGMEVSSDGSTFNTTAIFPQTDGVASGTLHLRLKNNAAAGAYDSQNTVLTSPGVSTNVATTATGNTVAAKALTIASATAKSKIFDGTDSAIVIATLDAAEAFGTGSSSDGKPYTGDAVTAVCTGSTFASSAVGVDIPVTAGTFSLAGASAGNYAVTPPSFPSLSASILSSAIWTDTGSSATWSTTTNWLGGLVGAGAGNTADFNQVDLPADATVNLTSSTTIGNLIFGDTETTTTPAGWTLTNNSTPANTLVLAGTTPTITVNALGTGKGVSISAVIAGSAGMTKTGAGTLTLSAANTYTGGTTVNNGTLKLGNGTAITTGPLTLTSPGVLDLNGFNYSGVSQFNGNGTLDNSSASAKTLTVGNNNTGGTFSGIIQNSGGGAITLQKFGTGNIQLTGLNTFTGQTKIGGGTTSKLSINTIGNVGAGASSLGNPTDAAAGTINLGFAAQGGSLVYIGSGHSTDRVINLANTAADTLGITANGSGALVFTSDFTSTGACAKTLTLNGTSTFNNSINGRIVDNSPTNKTSLSKAQAGTWIVAADNTYTGTTTVAAGTLIVNGTHSTGDAYSVSASGTLGGSGTISAAVSVSGKIAPGQGIGTLTTGPLAFNDLSTLAIEINTSTTTADKIIVNGDVTRPGSSVDLTLTDLGSNIALPTGTKLTLVDYSGTWDVSKTLRFNGTAVANDSSIALGANVFTVKYDDSTAMTLTVVNPYDAWSAGLTNPAFDFDSDGDGIANGLEWILGGNASANDSPSVLPSVTGDATTGLTLSFTREEDSIAGTTLSVEYSTTLSGTWSSAVIDQDGGTFPNGVVVTINQAASPDQVTVVIPASNAPDGALFARLKATRP